MAKTLKQYRDHLYMSVPEFAKFLDISVDTLYRIQAGERPRNTTIRRIGERLGVQPEEIAEFASVVKDFDLDAEQESGSTPPLGTLLALVQLTPPTPEQLAAATAAIDRANEEGWFKADPATGSPSGEVEHIEALPHNTKP